MYVTRPLSLYYNSPTAVTEPPSEGPNLGILVIEDEAAEQQKTCCWGLVKTSMLSETPFPQNKMIEVTYSELYGQYQAPSMTFAYFIPVLGQPLSSNRYYVISAHGKHKGKTCTCSKEEDATTCCFSTCPSDVEPRHFDHRDIYQQVEIVPQKYEFHAISVASDGIPEHFLRMKNWRAYTSKPSHYSLGEALGMNTARRIQMPDLNFPISTKYSPSLIVGKWFCPYIFVKEGERLKDQMQRSMFYKMTLEQFWEEVYSAENLYSDVKEVKVDVRITMEVALLNESEAVNDNPEVVDGVVWFKPAKSTGNGLGLSLPIWERMRWEAERGGFVSGEAERIERTKIHEGKGGWRKFGCYVLVEKFVLRRMDGSMALSYEFKHSNKIRTKWE